MCAKGEGAQNPVGPCSGPGSRGDALMNRPCPRGTSVPPGRSLAAAWHECRGVRKGEGEKVSWGPTVGGLTCKGVIWTSSSKAVGSSEDPHSLVSRPFHGSPRPRLGEIEVIFRRRRQKACTSKGQC